MPICGYSQEDRDYARECDLQDLEDCISGWSRAIAIAEQLSVDADNRGDEAEAEFWAEVMRNCEERWKEASRDYDDYLHWGAAA